MYITEIKKDGDLRTALNSFIVTVDTNQADLDISAGQVSALNLLISTFSQNLDESQTAKDAAKSAVSKKDGAKSDVRASVASYAKTWRANASISDSLLTALQLPTHSTPPTSLTPKQPVDLNYSIDSMGLTTVKWKSNGNKPGVVYIVETAAAGTGPWTTFDVVTSRKITFQLDAGESVSFRVTARRAGQSSSPSVPISVWGGGGAGEGTLQIAA